MSTEKCGIYQIVCGPTGKSYVGSSVAIYRRWSQHRRELRYDRHYTTRMQEAWNRHGEAAFHFTILQECSRDDLEILEQHYIDTLCPEFNIILEVERNFSPEVAAKRAATLKALAALRTHCPRGHPYGAAAPRSGGRSTRWCKACQQERKKETPDQRRLRLEKTKALIDNNNTQSDQFSPEHRAKISVALMGRKLGPESRAKLRAFNLGKTQSSETIAKRAASLTGHETSPETRAKISAALAGREAEACPNGHPYTPETIYVAYDGRRHCRLCIKARKRRHRQKKATTETAEERAARLAKRYEKERGKWHEYYERSYAKRKARLNDGSSPTPDHNEGNPAASRSD